MGDITSEGVVFFTLILFIYFKYVTWDIEPKILVTATIEQMPTRILSRRTNLEVSA